MLLSEKLRPRFFYGWVIVAVAFAAFVVLSTVWGSFAVFYVAFVDEFAWSRMATAGVFSVFVAMMGLAASLAGWLVDRFGARRVMPTGAAILAVGLALASRVSEPWHLYLVYGAVIPIGVNCTGIVPHLRLISNWFERQRGTAFGIATAGFGIGSVVLLPTVQYLVLQFGWRGTYLAMAGFALLLAPLTGFFHRQHPRQMGLLPDGQKAGDLLAVTPDERSDGNGTPASAPLGDNGLGKAMSTASFWVIFALNACLAFSSLISVFQVAHVVGIGFQPMLAATISGLAGLLNAIGRILGGFLSDRFGKGFAGFIGVWLLSLGTAASVLAGIVHESGLLFAFSLFYGLGWGFLGITAQAIAADLFRGRSYGTVAGFLELGAGIGGFIGPWLGGYVFDRFGSYTWAFAIAVVSVWVAGALLRLAYRGVQSELQIEQVEGFRK